MRLERFIKIYLPVILRYGSVSNHPLLRTLEGVNAGSVAKRILHSSEFGVCYFRMPKAGSSTVLATLGYNIFKREVSPAFVQKKLHRLPSMEEIREAFTFTIVRHPESRVLSAYLDKSRSMRFHKKFPFLGHSPGTQKGFLYFLDALEDGALYSNTHWAPQAAILPIPPEDLDFVGRFETFEQDLQHCMSRIFTNPTEIKNHRPHQTRSHDIASGFVNGIATDKIRHMYRSDFALFYPQDQ